MDSIFEEIERNRKVDNELDNVNIASLNDEGEFVSENNTIEAPVEEKKDLFDLNTFVPVEEVKEEVTPIENNFDINDTFALPTEEPKVEESLPVIDTFDNIPTIETNEEVIAPEAEFAFKPLPDLLPENVEEKKEEVSIENYVNAIKDASAVINNELYKINDIVNSIMKTGVEKSKYFSELANKMPNTINETLDSFNNLIDTSFQVENEKVA